MTPAGLRAPAGPVLSAGEAEALAAKAARGAGLPWGLAEEAGFAARWLTARGIDGLGALARLLDGSADAESGLLLGVRISDEGGGPGPLGAVAAPVLLLPFLWDVARAEGGALGLDWEGGAVSVSADALAGDVAALALLDVAGMRLAAPHATKPWIGEGPRPVDPLVLQGLEALALRTAVPTSAASRAGAGEDESEDRGET